MPSCMNKKLLQCHFKSNFYHQIRRIKKKKIQLKDNAVKQSARGSSF